MTELDLIKKEVELLKLRNKRVERNKAWETSLTRKVIILVLTYVLIGVTFVVIGNFEPWVNAIVPTTAFFISTLTLPFVKGYWEKHIYKR